MAERTNGPLLGAQEAADYLGVSLRTIRRMVAERDVPHFKVGRLIRFTARDLDEWLEQHRVPVVA